MIETKNNNYSYKFIIWIVITIFYVYQYALRILPDAFATFFIENNGITSDKLGQIFGIYYIGYAVMHIPFGILADTGRIKVIVSGAILGIILSLWLMNISSDNWIIILIARFLLGACSAAAWITVIKVSLMYFKRFAIAISMAALSGNILSGYSNAPLFSYYQVNGWVAMNNLLIYIVLVILVISLFILPNKPLYKQDSSSNEKQKYGGLFIIFKSKEYVMYCILAGLMVGIIEGFVGGWAHSFFEKSYGNILTNKEISTLLPILLTSFGIGTPIISILCEITKKDFIVLIGAATLMLVSFSLALSGILENYQQVATSCLVMGLASGYQCSIMALAVKRMPQEISGLASSIVNMIIMSAGYVFHSIIGLMMNDATLYDFKRSLSVIPIGLILAIFLGIYLHINDKKIKSY